MLQPLAQKRVLLITLVICFLVITGLLFYSSQERIKETWAEKVFNIIFYPFQKTIHYVTSFIAETNETIKNLAALNRENYHLRKKLSELTTELSQLEQLEAENERLRAILQYKAASKLELIPTEVVARNPSNSKYTIIIGKGKNYGLAKNMPVITEEGIVGRILNVNPFSAEVILLTDPRGGNSMSGVIERTRELVYIYGGGRKGYCIVKPSDLSIKLEVGDRILTSEANLYFPKNLLIGYIAEVNDSKDGYEQQAYLKPAANFGRMEYLYIVKEK